MDLHKLTLHHETRDNEQHRREHQRDVIGDEVGRVPVTVEESGEAAEEEDHGDRYKAIPRCVRLEGGFEREEGTVEALSVPAGPEADVGLCREASCQSRALEV